jgi:hypothetical protein
MTEQKVKLMNINVEVSLHDAFKAATPAKGENMTDVLLHCKRLTKPFFPAACRCDELRA